PPRRGPSRAAAGAAREAPATGTKQAPGNARRSAPRRWSWAMVCCAGLSLGVLDAHWADRRHWACRARILLSRVDRSARELPGGLGTDDGACRRTGDGEKLEQPRCAKPGRHLCAPATAIGGSWCGRRCRDFDGRAFLHARARADLALATPECAAGGRCGD